MLFCHFQNVTFPQEETIFFFFFYCVEQESLQAEESFMLAAELDSWLNEHGLYQRKDNKVGAEGSKVLTRYIWLMCQHLVCQKIFRNS